MEHFFRVIVLDDDEQVIEKLRERVATTPKTFEGSTWRIDLRPILIRVESPERGRCNIAKLTLDEIASACRETPHLVLADYGYAPKEVIQRLREQARSGIELTLENIAGQALMLPDLATAAREYIRDPSVDSYKRRAVEKNFVDFRGRLFLYSYTSKEFLRLLGPIKARETATSSAFPLASVVGIDTQYEFYNGEEFDSKHDGRFYAHLVSGLINQIVRRELLDHMLIQAKGLKYVRLRRSSLAIGFVVALGGAIGVCSEWIGGRVLALSGTGAYGVALSFAGLCVLWLFGMGILAPLVFERVLTGLMVGSNTEDGA